MGYGTSIYGSVLYGLVAATTPTSVSVRGPARFQRWYECVVCGFSYPASELVIDRWNRRVCIDCDDEPNNTDAQREGTQQTAPLNSPWPQN